MIHEALDVDASKCGKKSSRVTIKRNPKSTTNKTKSNNNKSKDDKRTAGRKRASYQILILSKDIISAASNGQSDVAQGLAEIRGDLDVWDKIEGKCKLKIMSYPTWSFPAEIIGDIRNGARNELKLFEADANLSQEEEWWYVSKSEKGKINVEEAMSSTNTAKFVCLMHEFNI